MCRSICQQFNLPCGPPEPQKTISSANALAAHDSSTISSDPAVVPVVNDSSGQGYLGDVGYDQCVPISVVCSSHIPGGDYSTHTESVLQGYSVHTESVSQGYSTREESARSAVRSSHIPDCDYSSHIQI